MLPNKMQNFNSKYSNVIIVLVYLIYLICNVQIIDAFNLSPQPNIIIHESSMNLKPAIPKTRSSYFGFTINLKQNSIIIGAPRAQSTLDSQRKINESGAVYKCQLDQQNQSVSDTCAPFVFDTWGNVRGNPDDYAYNNEMKDNQWLGASMDGSAHDDDKFVVCAPRFVSDIPSHYLMHGICYWTSNTSSTKPLNVKKIAPLRLKDKQQFPIGGTNYFYYMYGEQGISVHITENNEEILIGAPGTFVWKGTVIRYKPRRLNDNGGLSRRDEDGWEVPRSQRLRKQSENIEYRSDVPNPIFWEQDDNSLFGFAVSSGYFDGRGNNKLLYVASAPQANLQQGEVYIFDIVDHFSASDKTIKVYYKFLGSQFGEFFGYSLITDDFDNDGFTDIAIGAPFHSKDGTQENGAVYIYRNDGSSTTFSWQTILQSKYTGSGRFGITMSKIGDINEDGYNDLAIGAPFEDNGVVYIYHGGPNGILTKPSQRLVPPENSLLQSMPMQMFGHGISKAVDIDGNKYMDLAVGAPNADTVYIYKAYPIVKVNASINPFSNEIKTTDNSFKFNACWMIESANPINFDPGFHAVIKLDGQLGRATFIDQSNRFELNGTATSEEQCIELTAYVVFSIKDIFNSIELEMTYEIVNGVPQNSNQFCANCAAVNPSDPKSVKNKVAFSTGCKSAKCIADLKVRSSLVDVPNLPYILGSSTSLTIEYAIENAGETAYLAQIRVTLPEQYVSFAKTPSNCQMDDDATNIMVCTLNGNSPLFKDDKTSMKISIDTTKLDGTEFTVKANVFSTGDELNDTDNSVENVITLGEFSDVEVIGDSSKDTLSLENGLNVENLTHTFEIHNNGPSTIKALNVEILIPISHLNPWTLEREQLIEFSGISIKGVYNNQRLEVEWSQNNTILIANAVETTTTPGSNVAIDNFNGMQFDTSRIGLEYDLSGGHDASNTIDSIVGDRRKRSVEANVRRRYSHYLQKVIDDNEFDSFGSLALNSMSNNRYRRDVLTPNDRLLNNLPVNRTIYFDCQNAEQELCIVAKFTVLNFKASDLPISISLNFSIDLSKIDKIVTEKRDIFVLRTSSRLSKVGDEDGSSLHVVQTNPYTVISKYLSSETPLWVFILSILLGILVLVIITYCLHKFGFFKRGKREELVKLKRESQAIANYQTEDEE